MCAFRALFALDSRPCSSQGQALRGNGGCLPCQWEVLRLWIFGVFAHTDTHHSPLEGESARRGRKPDVAPVGGAAKAPPSPHRPREPQGPHTPHRGSRRLTAWLPRLPLKGGVMGREGDADPDIRLLRLPLKGGVAAMGIFSLRLRNGWEAAALSLPTARPWRPCPLGPPRCPAPL